MKQWEQIHIEKGYVFAESLNNLKGAAITLPFESVGATENIIFGGYPSKWNYKNLQCQREPEITDLCLCLKKMGAEIAGEGTSEIIITGVSNLNGAVIQ